MEETRAHVEAGLHHLWFRVYLPLVSWEWRNGEGNSNYYHGLYTDYYTDPFLHSR